MRAILAILIIIILNGCSIKNNLIGKYSSNTNPNSFEFKSDSSFYNEYREGHAVKYSKGTWRMISHDTILLNSEIKSIDVPLKVTNVKRRESELINISINLNIKDGEDLSNYHCYVYLNDKVNKIIRCDSVSYIKLTGLVNSLSFVFSKDPIQAFQSTFPVTTEKLIFDRPLSNDLKVDISFNEAFFNYHPFNNQKIKVARNRIQLFNSYLNKWQDIPKVSDKTNIFVQFSE